MYHSFAYADQLTNKIFNNKVCSRDGSDLTPDTVNHWTTYYTLPILKSFGASISPSGKFKLGRILEVGSSNSNILVF